MRLIAASIAMLAVGFALKSAGTYRTRAEPPRTSVFGAIHPNSFDLPVADGSQIPDRSGARVARLEAEVASESAIGEAASEPLAANAPCDPFDERFYFDRQLASFDERFAGAAVSPGSAATKAAEAEERANNIPPVTTAPAGVRERRFHTAEATAGLSLPLDANSHTAIYDIVARTVYLPNGHRLEAHSGLGSHLDDPRYVNTKGQGPTPPNVYNLTLRERLFHGVRAIRLVPVDDGKMFGRDGILAHTYMLGPSGQSNGCVSFRNYPAFLTAFLRGEVDRLVVVDHLSTTGAKTSAANRG
jgi:type VI secretion system (T6SS) effector TldE1-like protein